MDDIPGLLWDEGEPVRRTGGPRRRKLHAGAWVITGARRQTLVARRDFEPLLHPSDIGVEVVADLRGELLREHGVEPTSEPLVAQVEVAVEQFFSDGATGLSYLQALAEAELPRLTRSRFDWRRVRSVDWRQPRGKKIVARVYDHGAGHSGRVPYARPGEVIRIEVVGRWPAGDRRAAADLAGTEALAWAADVWSRRTEALARSVDGKLLRTGSHVERLLFEMVDKGLLDPSAACRYLGNVLWVRSGRVPTKGIEKQVRQLRERHGIRLGSADREETVRLGLSELMGLVRESIAVWGASHSAACGALPSWAG